METQVLYAVVICTPSATNLGTFIIQSQRKKNKPKQKRARTNAVVSKGARNLPRKTRKEEPRLHIRHAAMAQVNHVQGFLKDELASAQDWADSNGARWRRRRYSRPRLSPCRRRDCPICCKPVLPDYLSPSPKDPCYRRTCLAPGPRRRPRW